MPTKTVKKARKECSICCSEVSFFFKSPRTCTQTHGNGERACDECWEAHLSAQVEAHDPTGIECMFCTSPIDRTELNRLAHVGTVIRYDIKIRDGTRHLCQNRCKQSVSHGLQPHDRTMNGRVFTCKFCGFQTCVDCDRPEHVNETCEEYKTRVVFGAKHCLDNAETRAACNTCPSCDTVYELEKGCGYLQCSACAYRFCSRCMIPWVGEDSAYLGGKEAHWESCKYRIRDEKSDHGLKRRFEEDEETKNRIQEKAVAKKQKREAKRLVGGKAETKKQKRKAKKTVNEKTEPNSS